MKDETLHTAFQSWENLSGTPEEVSAYESRLKRVLDEEAAVREAELRVQEAELRVEEARQEVRQEEKEATARRLIVKGMKIEEIAEITELSVDLVKEIQGEIKN